MTFLVQERHHQRCAEGEKNDENQPEDDAQKRAAGVEPERALLVGRGGDNFARLAGAAHGVDLEAKRLVVAWIAHVPLPARSVNARRLAAHNVMKPSTTQNCAFCFGVIAEARTSRTAQMYQMTMPSVVTAWMGSGTFGMNM